MIRARDAGLAEATGERADAIGLAGVGFHRNVGVLFAPYFVVAGLADGIYRASGNASATDAMGIEKAVGMTV